MSPERLVVDTGVLISRILKPLSVSARAVAKARRESVILISEELITELAGVLARPKLAA